jgi:protein-disulfide isomerase
VRACRMLKQRIAQKIANDRGAKVTSTPALLYSTQITVLD